MWNMWNEEFEICEEEKLMSNFPRKDRQKREERRKMKYRDKKRKISLATSSERSNGLRAKPGHYVSRNSKKAGKKMAHKVERKSEFGNGIAHKSLFDVSSYDKERVVIVERNGEQEVMTVSKRRYNVNKNKEKNIKCRVVLQIS